MKSLIIIFLSLVSYLEAESKDFHTKFFNSYCIDCHNHSKSKGDLDLSSLPFDFKSSKTRDQWELILEYVEDGDMPTKKAKAKLPDSKRDLYVKKLKKDLSEADKQLTAGGSSLRRLTNVEYENSIKTLFPIRNLKLPPTFPKEGQGEGFDTDAAHQYMTTSLFQEYSNMANEIAGRMVLLPDSEVKSYNYKSEGFSGYPLKKKNESTPFFTGKNINVQSGALSPGSFSAPYSGKYNFKLTAWSEANKGADGKPLTLEIYAVDNARVNQHLLRIRDMILIKTIEIKNTSSKTLTTALDLEKGDKIYIFCKNRYIGNEFKNLKKGDKKKKQELEKYPSVALKNINIHGPVTPNKRQVEFLGDYQSLNEINSLRVILKLAEAAYRRPLTETHKKQFIKILKDHISKDKKHGLLIGTHYSLRKILCSPHYLFREMKSGKLDSYDLASRLSYFIWSSPPDEELLKKAADRSLLKKSVLDSEVERLLKSRKSIAFTSNFAGQWLGNRHVASVMVCDVRHTWGEGVRADYIKCTDSFFEEILKKNLSIKNFIDSDFTFETPRVRMALGLEKVNKSILGRVGGRAVKIKVIKGSNKGGLLGLPGIMLATSDGVESSPILRGVWVLDHLFGTPPPPPPDNVEVGKVDVTKAKTVKEMLQMHKEQDTCNSCHKKMDPLGLALENFDAVGKWRTNYKKEVGGELVEGPEVESKAVMPDGTLLSGSHDIKQYLFNNNHMFTRSLIIKLMEYGTGRKMTPGDKVAIQKIVDNEPTKGFGLRDLIKRSVTSDVFLTK